MVLWCRSHVASSLTSRASQAGANLYDLRKMCVLHNILYDSKSTLLHFLLSLGVISRIHSPPLIYSTAEPWMSSLGQEQRLLQPKAAMHMAECPTNNRKIRIKTQPVTEGTDATVPKGLAYTECMNKQIFLWRG